MDFPFEPNIFKNLPFPAVLYERTEDGSDFTFKDVNNKCLELEKMTSETILGKTLKECFPGVEEFGLIEVLHRVCDTGKYEHLPTTMYSDDRISGYRENWVYPAGEGRVFVIYYDRDDYMKIYQSLEEQKMIALRFSRLSSLGEYSASISHEIKNPLTLIIGRVRVLINRCKKIEANTEFVSDLEKIANDGMRIKKLMDSVLNFSRGNKSVGKESVYIRSILDDLFPYLESLLKLRKINLVIENEDQNLEVKCVPIQIQQVLTNLINNSIQAVSEMDERWIVLNVKKIDEFVHFQVQDSGAPLSEELKEKIGTKLFTTKGDKGTGLGLYLCHQIAESHGGELVISNESNHPTFKLIIPV